MVFECQSVWNWSDLDELVSEYPCLRDYGVRLVDKTNTHGSHYQRIEITVNSLEELMELSKKVGHPLILDEREPTIEIYDSYRE